MDRERTQAVATAITALTLFAAAATAAVPNWMPRAIVYAPNTDKKIDPAADRSTSRLAKLGVDRQLRVDVGPPEASLSVWILEPKTNDVSTADSPRGTILVLHGVQD